MKKATVYLPDGTTVVHEIGVSGVTGLVVKGEGSTLIVEKEDPSQIIRLYNFPVIMSAS